MKTRCTSSVHSKQQTLSISDLEFIAKQPSSLTTRDQRAEFDAEVQKLRRNYQILS